MRSASAARPRILIVEDDPSGRQALERILIRSEYEVRVAVDGREALMRLEAENFDLIISDVRMPNLSGLELLKAVQQFGRKVPVILMTAFGSVSDAVSAMKLGAVDFISKPFRRQELLTLVRNVLAERKSWQPHQLRYTSSSMRELESHIARAADSPASVLIQGESGTGKERVARLLHERGRGGPFVAVNCGALPANLIESELFGVEAGAYTGAGKGRKGLIESADQGTLLLDEVAELPLELQVKLLRAVQEGKIRRVGGTQEKSIDVRWMSASHQDIAQAVSEGRFREDLFFRLNVLTIRVPSLRERIEDLPALIGETITELKQRYPSQSRLRLSTEAVQALSAFRWPGNIRQLENVLERAFVLAGGQDSIGLSELPRELQSDRDMRPADVLRVPLHRSLKEVEEQMIDRALRATDGDKQLAAKLLGVNPRTIYRRLERRRPDASEDSKAGPDLEPPRP
jgi:DNA-binding NtrC family response regulator